MLGFSNSQQNIQDRNNMQPISGLPVPMNQQPMQRNTIQRSGPMTGGNMNVLLNTSSTNNTNGNGNGVTMNSMNPNSNNVSINNSSSMELNNMNSSSVGHQNQNLGQDGLYNMYPYPMPMMNSNSNGYYPYSVNNYSIYQQPPQQQPPSMQPSPQPPSNQPYYMSHLSQPPSQPSQNQNNVANPSAAPSQSQNQNTSQSSAQSQANSQGQPPNASLQNQPSQAPFYGNPNAASSYLMEMPGGQGLGHNGSNIMGGNPGGFNSNGNNGGGSMSCNNALNGFDTNPTSSTTSSSTSMNYSSGNGYSPFKTNLYVNFNSNGYHNGSSNASGFNTNSNPSLNNSTNSSVVSTPNPYNANNYRNGGHLSGNVNSNVNSVNTSGTIGLNTNNSPSNGPNGLNGPNGPNGPNAPNGSNGNNGVMDAGYNTHIFNHGFHASTMNNANTNAMDSHNHSIPPFVSTFSGPLNPNAAVFTSVNAQNNNVELDYGHNGGDPNTMGKDGSESNGKEVNLSKGPTMEKSQDALMDSGKVSSEVNANDAGKSMKETGEGGLVSGQDTMNAASMEGHPSFNASSTTSTPPSSNALNGGAAANKVSTTGVSNHFMGNSSYGGLTTSSNVIGSGNSAVGTPPSHHPLNANTPFNNYNIGSSGMNRNGMNGASGNSKMGLTGNGGPLMNGMNFGSGASKGGMNSYSGGAAGGMMSMPVIPPNGMNGSHLMGNGSVFSSGNNWTANLDGRLGGLPSMGSGNAGPGSNAQGMNNGLGNGNMKLMMNSNGLGSNMNAFSMSSNTPWDWNSGSNYPYNGFYDSPGSGLSKFNGSGSGEFYPSGGENRKNAAGPQGNLLGGLGGNGSGVGLSSNGGFNILGNSSGSGLLSNTGSGAVGKGRMNNGLGITSAQMTMNTMNTMNTGANGMGPSSGHSSNGGSGVSGVNGPVDPLKKSEDMGMEELKNGSSGVTTPSGLSMNAASGPVTAHGLLSGKSSKEDLVASLNSKEFVPGLSSLTKEMSSLKLGRDKIFGSNASSLKPSPNLAGMASGERRMSYGGAFNSNGNGLNGMNMNGSVNYGGAGSGGLNTGSFNPSASNSSLNFSGSSSTLNFNPSSSNSSLNFNPSNSTSSINTLVNYSINGPSGAPPTTNNNGKGSSGGVGVISMNSTTGSNGNSMNGSNNISNSSVPVGGSVGTEVVLKKKKSLANVGTLVNTNAPIQFTTRPGFGQAGRKIKLKANFYAIQNLPIENIHQYEFAIVQKSPRKDTNISPELLRLLYQRWWEIFKKENHKPLYPVFDGRHYIFSATPLPFANDKNVYTINLVRDGNVSSERVFEITLRKVQEISMTGLHKFLEGKNLEVPTEALQVIDTIFRHFPSFLDNQFSIVGRSFFTNDDIEEISNGVQLWRGHHQSLKASRNRLLINIDISATAFYKPGSLKDVIQNFFGKDDLKILLNDTERQHIESFLKGIKIKINYRDNSRRTYKILRFSNLPANQQMITNIQTKNEQSVTDYFKETYGITLKYPHIPCIDVGKVSQPIYIPIELCEVPDGQKYLKKLNEKQTTEMIKFTCQLPNLREGKINSGRKRLQPDNNEYFNSLNLGISNQMEVVDARILPAPTIVFNKDSQEPKIRPNGGIWSLKNKKLALGSTLSSWSILAFGKETDYPRETINNFLVELVKTLKENGVNVRDPNPPIVYGNKNEIEESLYKAYHEACHNDVDIIKEEEEGLTSISPGINRKLILCILPSRVNNTTPYYAEIKRIADTVIGVVTQCIQGRHITAPIKSYCGNLSLKINVKLGGYNNFILPEQIRFIMEEPTIVFGGNVTNPGPGDRIHPSIVALVGSMDCQCSHYIATTRIQERKKECIIKLSEMIGILFKKFYKINELMPNRILFYRDSISESQYQSVMQYELNEIWEACKQIDPDYRPTITYIVVQKRHHARFFPMRKEESDSKGNILAGTVIESLITHPSQFDFYLCSHPGLQGTSRPTHYHVLYDEHNFTADELEELTYHMCFLYSRSTRAVSIVPPAYYAHLAAARVKYHAHEAWNEQEQQQQQQQSSTQTQTQSTSGTTATTSTTTTNSGSTTAGTAANSNASGTTTNDSSPALGSSGSSGTSGSSESVEGTATNGSNSTLASSASSPTLEKSNLSSGNQTLTSSPSASSLKTTQPIRRVLYEPVKEELQEIMYFM